MTQPYLVIAETKTDRRKARDKLNNAVKGGLAKKPERCELCAAGGSLQAHHFRGYGKDHRLSVQWLCPECHKDADQAQREQDRRLWSSTVSLEYA